MGGGLRWNVFLGGLNMGMEFFVQVSTHGKVIWLLAIYYSVNKLFIGSTCEQ